MKLNDKEIRGAFNERLRKLQGSMKIIEELNVANGRAIADIVTVSKHTHCYEIKGENDKIERLIRQSKFYDLAFNKITLITTSNHIKKAVLTVPKYWGIIEVKFDSGKVKFVYVRKSEINPLFDKAISLQTLWKSELLKIAENQNFCNITKYKSRDFIIDEIIKSSSKSVVSNSISEQLKYR